jgi:hypothetical protein
VTDKEITTVLGRLAANPNTYVDPAVAVRLAKDLQRARGALRRIADFPPTCLEAHVLQMTAREVFEEFDKPVVSTGEREPVVALRQDEPVKEEVPA